MSNDLAARKDALLLALLPNVPFDGWTRGAMRAAATRAGIDLTEFPPLFPRGPRDAAAWFSDWADRQTVAELKRRRIGTLKIRARIATGVLTRLAILLPHREAVRRALSLLATPANLPLAAKLLYGTVDTIWHAAGDRSTDFNFYTKRGLLAGVYAATTLIGSTTGRRIRKRPRRSSIGVLAKCWRSRSCARVSSASIRCASSRRRASGSAPRDKLRHMAHLAARHRLVLAVEMDLLQRIVDGLAPFLDIGADQILHHRVGMALGRAERQAADRAH
jgi:rpsU-divergently transcribed protein